MDIIGIIETLGIPVAVSIGLGYALMYLIKFITKDVTADIKNLYNIVVKLIDSNREAKDEVKKTMTGVNTIKELGYKVNTRIIEKDEFYFHADYRRDLNYNYCKKVDYVMWGETDSFFPKEAFEVIESLSKYTDEQNIHRYMLSFADRKMWDASWDIMVHPIYENHIFIRKTLKRLPPNIVILHIITHFIAN